MTLTDSRPQITEPATPVTVIDPLSAYCVPRLEPTRRIRMPQVRPDPDIRKDADRWYIPRPPPDRLRQALSAPATSYDDSDQSGGTGG